jgi:spore germination protein KC
MGCAEIIEDPTLQQSPEKGGDSSEVKQYVIRYKGLAAFRDGALQGYLDGIETRSFNILTGKFKSAVIELPSGDTQKEPGNVTLFQIINAKPDIKVKYEDDKVTVEANVKMKVGILQEAGKKDILNDDVKKQLSEDVRSIMESQLSAAVKKAQDLGCDVFGFGVAMHAQKPDEWRKIKDNWTEYFRNAEFQPKVEAVIVKTGESKAPFQLED